MALLVLPLAGCAQQGGSKMIREPAVANQFYPGNRDTLNKFLTQTFAQTPKEAVPGTIMGIAVPHAGYPYSGATAAYAFKAVSDLHPKTIVILGPSHHVEFSEFALYAKGAWKMPLGNVSIDEDFCAQLMKLSPRFKDMPEAHAQEHSIEVEVPFLQETFKDFRIVPIMICFADYPQLQELAQALAATARGKDVLFVASSDLYHGYSFTDCEHIDSTTLCYLERFDPRGFFNAFQSESAQACGGLPITALMLTLRQLGATDARVLHRTNSNIVTGVDTGYCVGYGATVFYQKQGASAKEPSNQVTSEPNSQGANDSTDESLLTKDEQQELLRIARTTLDSTIRTSKVPGLQPRTGRLSEYRGVFVTLNEHGNLRGCIGYIDGIKPLYQAVSDMAVAASTQDYRFPPVDPRELKDINVEITVLTPMQLCPDPEHMIVLGKHGIVVKRGNRQGVFLPQVATETGWDVETFLSECCSQKAGLAPDAWKDKGTQVYTFLGQVFGEKE
jgi:AmmeMemoRadiSam system protein B/AmmeMemoRadiSam system protein A